MDNLFAYLILQNFLGLHTLDLLGKLKTWSVPTRAAPSPHQLTNPVGIKEKPPWPPAWSFSLCPTAKIMTWDLVIDPGRFLWQGKIHPCLSCRDEAHIPPWDSARLNMYWTGQKMLPHFHPCPGEKSPKPHCQRPSPGLQQLLPKSSGEGWVGNVKSSLYYILE